MISEFICDGLLAAGAGIGFGAISGPSRSAYPFIAFLAASGHMLRFALMRFTSLEIVGSSFIASLLIGALCLLCSKRNHLPPTSMYIPALLPMIPGTYAYKTILELLLCLNAIKETPTALHHLSLCLLNAVVTFSAISALAVGATLVVISGKKIFPNLTRKKK